MYRILTDSGREVETLASCRYTIIFRKQKVNNTMFFSLGTLNV